MIPITTEALLSWGFTKWNDLFTYLSFPAPLYGSYRIDYRTPENERNVSPTNCWYIFVTNGDEMWTLKYPKSMEEVHSFYTGICDKRLV